MINSRDSANTWNPNKKEQIEVPFSVGTVVELKEDPNVLAEILEYRITKKEIKVGLSYAFEGRYTPYHSRVNKRFISIHFSNMIDTEIDIEELEEKWQKIKQTTITMPEEKDRIRINIDLPDEPSYFEGKYTPVFQGEEQEAEFSRIAREEMANLSEALKNKSESIVPEGEPFFTSDFNVVEENGKKLVKRRKEK